MKKFNKSYKSGGGRDGGKEFGQREFRGGHFGGDRGRRRFGGGGMGKPMMHKAICSDCGKECEVPFKPTGDRPIYCSQCFGNHGKPSFSRPNIQESEKAGFGPKKMFAAVCDNCGNKCEVPFRPSGEKPVFCKQCFNKGGNISGQSTDQYKEQLEMLNRKIDKILNILNPAVPLEMASEKIVTQTIEEKKRKGKLTKARAVPKKKIKK